MTVERIEEIKEKIDEKKTEKIKAESQIENIEKEWKKMGIDSIEDAETKVEELTAEIAADEKKLNVISEKIEDVTDWDEL